MTRIADHRDDQQIAGTGRRHVEQPRRFLTVALLLGGALREQLGRCGAREPNGAEAALGVDVPARAGADLSARRIREDDHRKLETLGTVHGHETDAARPFLEDRRVARLAALAFGQQALDEGAKRQQSAALRAAREIHQAGDVGKRLLAGGPDREAGVRTCGREQTRDGVGDRTTVARAVQIAQHRERLADLGERGRQVGRQATERVQGREAGTKGEQRRVAEREQRPAQRGEDGEIVLGSLDGRERVADRLDLLALVERAAADQHVWEVACFEGADVVARHVATEGPETPEEETDVARVERHPGARLTAFADGPAAVTHQPLDERRHRVRERQRRSSS